MPSTLSKAGAAQAKKDAQDFLKQYKDSLKNLAVKVIRGVPKRESAALAYFKGKAKTSGYATTAFDAKRGCKTATVRLHPHPDWKDVELGGSKTLPNLPPALGDIKPYFPGERFISGHMINADFGGDHTKAANQTVLTHAANSQHDFDDAIKSAAKVMGRACYEMGRESNATGVGIYLDKLYAEWAIKINVTVGATSWADDGVLQNDPIVKALPPGKYPLSAVSTQIVFEAKAENTPDTDAIAKNLQIPNEKMSAIAKAISEFKQYMNEAARFELNQPAPANLTTARSLVTTTMKTLAGASTNKQSKGTLKPYTPRKVKGAPAPPKPAPKVYSYSLVDSGGSSSPFALTSAMDEYNIGASHAGLPWAADAVPDIYVSMDRDGATISWKGKEKGSVRVDRSGKIMTCSKDFGLRDGDVLVVKNKTGTEWRLTYVVT